MIGSIILAGLLCWILGAVMSISGYLRLHTSYLLVSDAIMCLIGIALMAVSGTAFMISFVVWLLRLLEVL